MLIEGGIYEGDRLERMDRNILIWQNVQSGRYGVYLYEKPPKVYDARYLLFRIRKNLADAEDIFFKLSLFYNKIFTDMSFRT
jgi:hypothetical protein